MLKSVYFKSNDFIERESKNYTEVELVFPLMNMILYKEGVTVKFDESFIKRIIDVEDVNNIPTGNLIVKFNNSVSLLSYLLNNDIKYSSYYDRTNFVVITIPNNVNLNDFKTEFESLPFVEFAELDIISESDMSYEFTYNHPYHWYLQDMNSYEAWQLMTTPQSGPFNPSPAHVEVAMWDTAPAINHPELQGKISEHSVNCNYILAPDSVSPQDYGLNYDSLQNCPTPIQFSPYHGTGVAGLIAALNSNDDMMLSVGNDKVKVQILTGAYLGYSATTNGLVCRSYFNNYWTVLEGLNHVFNNPKCVALTFSMSITPESQTIQEMFNLLATQGRAGNGIVIFSAAGNYGLSGGTEQFVSPCGYNYVYSVGASTIDHLRPGWSSYGDGLFIAAPGEDIMSLSVPGPLGAHLPLPFKVLSMSGNTVPTWVDPDMYSTYHNLLIADGTSSSSPIVATIAATLIYRNPSLTRQQVIDILAATARKIGGDGTGQYYYENGICPAFGNGIIDHEAAMQMAIDYITDPLEEPIYHLGYGMTVDITNIPEDVEWGELIEIETETSTTENVLSFGEYYVLQFWFSENNYISPSSSLVGSYTNTGLSETNIATSYIQLPCADSQSIANISSNKFIIVKAQVFDENYQAVTFNAGTDQDSNIITLNSGCYRTTEKPNQNQNGPALDVQLTFLEIVSMRNKIISPEQIGGHAYKVRIRNIGLLTINSVNLILSIGPYYDSLPTCLFYINEGEDTEQIFSPPLLPGEYREFYWTFFIDPILEILPYLPIDIGIQAKSATWINNVGGTVGPVPIHPSDHTYDSLYIETWPI